MKNLEIVFDDATEVCKAVDFGPLDGATVFITGATGLLGTNFLASLCLLKEAGMGLKVFAQCHSSPAKHTLEIVRRGDFTLLTDEIPKGADFVIHAAGYAQPRIFTANPAETIRVNTAVTHELLKSLRAGGRFLFVSSARYTADLANLLRPRTI